ncbi:hypothetical protein PHLCEN_2v12866 [Hermanssonia centrifuga]|uniref:Uncharacterized protein n=1 Tax=Hermanssonia centrifuga TaxID=98765 RepID=A0A2R6NGW1_9APHY|nr:hypothetical protein PHLCEN_2v12866 [Hermanssonia centrifuga]
MPLTNPSDTHTEGAEILLSEDYVQNCFHSYLKSALTQAKAERLLDTELLSSAEGDLMITGPALCLYFAALRSTTSPPSVPLPRLSKNQGSAPTDLSMTNCPVAFRPFLMVWSQTVPDIQALVPEHQHDLARIICNLPAISKPPNLRLNGIAADLRAVAIEISMRRTFQDRYAGDLQAAIDAGNGAGAQMRRVKASFVPPPVYDAAASEPPPAVSPSFPTPTIPSPSYTPLSPSYPSASTSTPASPGHLTSPSAYSFSSGSRSPSPGPTLLPDDAPAIEFIRETLYAALADVLERIPSIRKLLRRDPARAYFAAVAFAILDVATTSVSPPPPGSIPNSKPRPDVTEVAIRGVLSHTLTLSECPTPLRPFMQELCAIGLAAREMEEEDSEATMQALQKGETPPVPRIDRVRDVLKGGVGWVYDDGQSSDEDRNLRGRQANGRGDSTQRSNGHHHHSSRHSHGSSTTHYHEEPPVRPTAAMETRRRTTSTENRAVAFANRINALALGMTKLRAFRERQEAVFKVLVGVTG